MSSSPVKDASPAKQQPVEKSFFTEKEEKVLKAAWHCLKSPPEIDIEKLRVAAEFNTTKTASNTWGTIKKKLASLAPPPTEGEGDAATTTTAAHKTKASASKKRAKKVVAAAGDDDDEEAETPAKKRKTPKVVAAENDRDEDEKVVKDEPVVEKA